ncbi:hypothetical protein Pcar_3336 [Syntrophotalea carbinolica DSM 2380]|uniref:Uncharacterized protein n=1 Tax=Syntrophotalea carbinolica (strain DSM 2380 / NBRC 103641 / GraBd1) TaxID=338963 RepID=Q0C6I6_SYNC1|nr:hypothetical protein Pcar_3336 [Syntrophotalea carbinolica DSM 2380]
MYCRSLAAAIFLFGGERGTRSTANRLALGCIHAYFGCKRHLGTGGRATQ